MKAPPSRTVPDIAGRDVSPIPRYEPKQMLAYLSGPMTGVEGFNFDAFNEAATDLRDLGYAVLNPAENFGGQANLPREMYLRVDLGHVLAADVVVVLPGWEDSVGASLEVRVARAIGTPVTEYRP